MPEASQTTRDRAPLGVEPKRQHAFPVLDSVDDFSDDATRRLLQRRLFLCFAVLAGVSLFYAVSPLLAVSLTKSRQTVPLTIPLATLAIGLCNGVLALRCRAGQRSLAELHTLDAAATTT
jgi:hypothetical protein